MQAAILDEASSDQAPPTEIPKNLAPGEFRCRALSGRHRPGSSPRVERKDDRPALQGLSDSHWSGVTLELEIRSHGSGSQDLIHFSLPSRVVLTG
jgi:hypothetical protein